MADPSENRPATGNGAMWILDNDVEKAKALLEGAGYVVLKATSYRRAQERQRIAEALRAAEERHNASLQAWGEKLADEGRYLRDRCTFLYGEATRRGASPEELTGPS